MNAPPLAPAINSKAQTQRWRWDINWLRVKFVSSAWTRRAACLQNPQGILCCARGGQRSHIVQSWLHAAGIDYPLVEGGYKALRQTAIQATIELAQKPIVLIGGCTGSGKTLLVQQQPNGVDLRVGASSRFGVWSHVTTTT